jgi:hypothetical protein
LSLAPTTSAAPQLPPLRRPSQRDWRTHLAGVFDEANALSARLAAGSIPPRQWGESFYDLLARGHAASWRMGRNRSGDMGADDAVDDLVGRAKADGDAHWLLRFVGDIESGKYTDEDGAFKLAAFKQRQALYVGKMRGTANEAFVESSADEEEFDWVLGGAEDHCPDCPVLAESSPWKKDEMFTHPGSGDTPCLSHCKCHLVRKSDGLDGFKP